MKKIILLISLFVIVSASAQVELITPYSNSWQSICVIHNARIVADGGSIPNYMGLLSANLENPNSIKALYDPDIIGYKAIGDSVGTLYSLKSGSDIVFAAGKRPRLLTWNSTDGNYLFCPETATQYFITDDAPANRITGSIDIDIKFKYSSASDLVGKYNSPGNVSYGLRILSSGSLLFLYSPDGTGAGGNWVTKSVSININDYIGLVKHIRVTRDLTSGNIKFYLKNGSNWDQIGSTQTSTAGQAIFAGTASVNLGNFMGDAFKGNIYECNIYNGIRENGGVLACSFKASDLTAELNSCIKSSTTGELWYNASYWGGTTDALKFVVVNRTLIEFDGLNHFGKAQFSIGNTATFYSTFQPLTFIANNPIYDGYVAGEAKFQMGTTYEYYKANGGTELAYVRTNPCAMDVCIFTKNGASSKIQSDNFNNKVGNAGNSNITGLSLGGDGTILSNFLFANLLIRTNTSISNSDIKKLKIIGKNDYTKLAYFLGNSITYCNSSIAPAYKRYTFLVSKSKGYKEVNLAVSGTSAQKRTPIDVNGTPNFVDRVASMSNCTDTSIKVFCYYGVNDIILSGSYENYTLANFTTDYTTAVTNLIAKGYKSSNIILIGVGYLKTITAETIESYNSVINTIATNNGCRYIPIRQSMIDAGGDAIMYDNVHPNQAGQETIATTIINAIHY